MAIKSKTPRHIRMNERNHVEEPFLKQLEGLGWTINDLELTQTPQESERENFVEVVILPELHRGLKRINPWLEDDQLNEVTRRITTFFGHNLIQNNQDLLRLLQENTSVTDNRKTGDRSPTVRFIDFENPDNNSFLAICQFKVRIPGSDNHIIPDIVLFINGLPMVVVECKSPKVNDPMGEAIDQLLRYSEQREDRAGGKREGNPQLFYYNQFVIATCRVACKFGTISSHIEKHYFRWADPYPYLLDQLERGNSSPNDQQRLVAGMLDHKNLLSLIRTFTLFTVNDKNKLIKIVARYQQFRAVKKAVKGLLSGNHWRERSGIIWHTQGSGKSLTMMFMVREMYRHPQLCKWKVVFVTDRTQLEKQLSETSNAIGFKVKKANSIARLKQLLPGDSSDLIMAMIHKFQERDLKLGFPELNANPNILIMTDEAHRSLYKKLGMNLHMALPNAAKIGYTGTPIDKTEKLFGDYIDKYTMRQSQEDGVTLEIIYEGRTHNAEIEDKSGVDTLFHDVFSDYNIQQRLQILGYGSVKAYLEAKETVKAKACDMIEHYVYHIFKNGFKAQVVATSKEGAVRYLHWLRVALRLKLCQLKKSNPQALNLDLLSALRVEAVFSSDNNDLPHIKACADKSNHQRIIKSFKMGFNNEDNGIKGDVGIVVVVNMLITGFDAPIEQVMYLDRKIVSHNLLQAIARVNRIGDKGKDKGFVIDYIGVGHHLKDAIDDYDDRQQKEILDSLSTIEDEINDLTAAHREIIELTTSYGIRDLSDHDAFFDLFYDEDIRFAYILGYKKLTLCLNVVFPHKEAQKFLHDYQMLTEVNVMASQHLRDGRLSMKGIPAKLRSITDQYLQSRGIDQRIEAISILDEEFAREVSKRKRTKTKAAEVEHAIRDHLDLNYEDDPELYASFAEALERILQEFRNNWQRIYEELERLRRIIKNLPKPPGDLDRKKQMPFYGTFSRAVYNKMHGVDQFTQEQTDHLVNLTREVYDCIEKELKLTGFWENVPSQNRLRGEIQKVLLSQRYCNLPELKEKRKEIITKLMETSKSNHDKIVHG